MIDVILLIAAVALAQSEPTKSKPETGAEKSQFQRWQKYYRRVAAEYEMEEGKDPATRLKLRPEPVLTYANPAGGGRSHGEMFVWTRDGRPEILASIWSRQAGERRQVIHEMHSLSLEPVTAIRNGNVFWSPSVPGIEPFLIPGAPVPAKSPVLRMVQMRSLVREFSASTVRATIERPLQFRPEPVFRMEKSSAEHDGALFVGYEDFDPELLMLIEVRATKDGPRWHAGFARFTNLPVSARHKDVPVYSFTANSAEGAYGGVNKRFYVAFGVEVQPATGPE